MPEDKRGIFRAQAAEPHRERAEDVVILQEDSVPFKNHRAVQGYRQESFLPAQGYPPNARPAQWLLDYLRDESVR